MNTTIARLIWKEYHAQRSVWLAVLFGWACIHLITRLAGVTPEIEMRVLACLAGCFMLISFTLCFAGEVDEQTVGYLRMLPCRTTDLVLGKLLSVILGTLGLLIAMSLSYLFVERFVIVVISTFAPELVRHSEDAFSAHGLLPVTVRSMASFFGSLVLGCGLSWIFSLICRRVFACLAATTVVFLVVQAIKMETLQSFDAGETPTFFVMFLELCLGAMCGVIAIGNLSRRWHQGSLPRADASEHESVSAASNGVQKRKGVLSPWLARWIETTAASPAGRHRVVSTLFWKELRSLVPFVKVWLPIGVLLCFVRTLTQTEYAMPAMFLAVFIHECGQRSVREDQRSGTLLSLSAMGVSARTIWSAKTICWLVTMLAGVLLICLVDHFAPESQKFEMVYNSIRHDSIRLSIALETSVTRSAVAFGVLLLFGMGQLTACWIRRQILAFAVSILMCLGAASFASFCLSYGLSLWITCVPAAAMLLVAAAWTAPDWVDGRMNRRIVLQRTMFLIVTGLVCASTGWTYWRYEPQMWLKELSSHVQYRGESAVSSAAEMQPAVDAFMPGTVQLGPWHDFGLLVTNFEGPLEDMAIGRGQSFSEQPLKPFRRPLSEEAVKALLQPFQEASTQFEQASNELRWPPLPLSAVVPRSSMHHLVVINVLQEHARILAEKREFNPAASRLINAVALVRHFSEECSSWQAWFHCLDAERRILVQLRRLLNLHADEMDLPQLYSQLKDFVLVNPTTGEAIFPDVREMLRRRTAFGQTMLNNNFLLPGSGLWGARARSVDVMAYSEALLNIRFQNILIGGNVTMVMPLDPVLTEHFEQLADLLEESPLLDSTMDFYNASAVPVSNPMFMQVADTVASERGTLLTLLLQQHRKIHGEFPATLFALKSQQYPEFRLVSTDPYTGAPFYYAPTGLTQPICLTLFERNEEKQLWASSRQPVLCTQGSQGVTLATATAPVQNASAEMNILETSPQTIVFLGILQTGEDWSQYRLDAVDPGVEKP